MLIDGLDETPDELSRERLGKLIREAAAAFDGCRFVVTSRPEGKVSIAGFEEALIGDLEPDAIRAFLEKLAKQLYPDEEMRERTFREDLEAAVNGRREIRKMTRNPVMLTALAVLQHNNVKLPEKRVDLYGSILEWLSKQRAKPGRMAASECLLRLLELALEMQRHEEGRKKQAPLAWAGEKLAKRFAHREAAEKFLRAEQGDSGIVVSRGPEIAYCFTVSETFDGSAASAFRAASTTPLSSACDCNRLPSNEVISNLGCAAATIAQIAALQRTRFNIARNCIKRSSTAGTITAAHL